MVFPYTTSPDDTVWVSITMPRCLNDWKQNHKSINFSGLCQEMLIQMLKDHDPEYYKEIKQFLPEIRRKDTTPKTKVTIYNNIQHF